MAEITKSRVANNRKPEDWIGFSYGRLTVTEIVGREGPNNALVANARCQCGNIKRVRINSLRDKTVASCGCLRDEVNKLPTEERPAPTRNRKPMTVEQRAKYKAHKLAWVKANPEKVKSIAKRAREKDQSKTKKAKASFYQKNKRKIIDGQKARYAADPRFRMEMLLRGRIVKAIQLRGARKSAPTMVLVGCSIDELMKHLESKFQSGMTWENRHAWHIDHIKPCASFNLMNPEEQRKCFHWTNLQPLWAKDNLDKRAKLTWTITPLESGSYIPAPVTAPIPATPK